jgi:hypothetical protein
MEADRLRLKLYLAMRINPFDSEASAVVKEA